VLIIGTVGHVLKLFAHDKDKDGHKDKDKDKDKEMAKLPARSATRESYVFSVINARHPLLQ
jgi:hypothetical protein